VPRCENRTGHIPTICLVRPTLHTKAIAHYMGDELTDDQPHPLVFQRNGPRTTICPPSPNQSTCHQIIGISENCDVSRPEHTTASPSSINRAIYAYTGVGRGTATLSVQDQFCSCIAQSRQPFQDYDDHLVQKEQYAEQCTHRLGYRMTSHPERQLLRT
jgi:hypothetical protein